MVDVPERLVPRGQCRILSWALRLHQCPIAKAACFYGSRCLRLLFIFIERAARHLMLLLVV